uniref:LIM domain 7b n=1 Tax=Fundulus heteroclitus TaxID=8078 RepID=A0A3Q2PRK1_FUNHE
MEWRQQSSVSCEDAFTETQRWIQEVTGKSFGCSDFRAALENGVLLCDLINQLKPGIIKRVNRLSTPIAGLDNVNVFLKACGKLGLNESQLFHPGDLQDLSTRVTLRRDESQRRLKNVLITIYWLGRKAQLDTFYSGPQLNFKAFEGLLGLALSKALEEGSYSFVKDGGYKECHYTEGEESLQTGQSYDRGSSVDGFECVDRRAVRLNEEGFESDAEAEQVYKMDSAKVLSQQNKGHIPAPLRRKQGREERAVGHTSQLPRSKSLSDIPMVYPVRKVSNGNAISDKGQDSSLPRDWNQEIERNYSVAARDSEAKWQDDLTRWKNRRRSTKSELYRRSFEREHIFKQTTNGSVTNYEGDEAPGGPIKRDQSSWWHSSSPRPYSVSPAKPLSSNLRPHTRGHLTSSYATEAPFISQSHSQADDCQSLMFNTQQSHPSSTKPSLKRQTAAAHLRGQYQASVRQKKANQARQNATGQKEEVNGRRSTQMHPQPYTKQQPCHNKSLALGYNASPDLSKVDHSDMRVSLTLRPNSLPDFGFQTHWDSTGVRIKYIQPGSPAEHCQLCVDDEVVTVDGVAVARMTYSQWKDKIASSLQTGNLTMDIRRYGVDDWGTNKGSHPNQSGQSKLTLNLTSAAPVLIGRSDHHANNAASTVQADIQESQLNGQTDDVTQEKATVGVFSGNATKARHKENNITRENQKKREEFFTQKGGSESAISDIQVPSLNPSSSSWSWDHEEDRRRQEKWQEEQERLLQEQYRRDQEKLEAEWQRAQQDAMESEILRENTAEVGSSRGTFATSQLYVNGLTKETKEKLNLGREDRKKAELNQNNMITEKDWAEGSHGFAQLSHAHRAMSMSTPALSGTHRQTRSFVDPRKRGVTVSKAERQRQQILEEMKKRTQLLTDNSWIRQRSGSFHKEPIDVGISMKRYESLDNLDILHQSPDSAATFTYPRPHSSAGGYGALSRNPSSRYSTGSISFQRNINTESSHHASVWAAIDTSEEQRLESRFASKTGGPTATTAISNSSPLLPTCDQHTVLQIQE